MAENENTQAHDPADYERLDSINDDLHIIRRLFDKPSAMMAAPEIMDITRMAIERVHSRYMDLAMNMRRTTSRQPA